MSAKVKLSDILHALESASDEHSSYVDRDTGEVYLLTDEIMDLADEETALDDLPEKMRESVEVARLVQNDDVQRFLELPGRLDIHELDIMDCFTSTLKEEKTQRDLRQSLRGAEPSRSFKRLIEDHKVQDAWQRFRDARLREIAVEWCEENHIPWREK